MPFLNFIFYSEFVVALVALSLIALTMGLLDSPIELQLLLFAFFSTYFFYTLERLFSVKKIDIPSKKNKWFQNNYKLNIVSLCLSFIGLIVSTYGFSVSLYLSLLFIFIIVLTYSIVPLPLFKQRFYLKNYTLSKLLLLIFSWLYLTIIVPLLYLNEVDFKKISIIGFYYFSWFLINAIIFDFRDIKMDKKIGISTIPQRIGTTFTKIALLVFNLTIIITFASDTVLEINYRYYVLIIPNLIYLIFIIYLIFLKDHFRENTYTFVDLVLTFPFVFFCIIFL